MENNDQNKINDVDQMLDQQSKQIRDNLTNGKKKSIFDIDLSWLAIVILGLAVFGVAYAFQQTKAGLGAGYVVLFVLVSLLLGVFVYALGKTIGAAINGYKLSYVSCLGICNYATSNGRKTTFEISKFLELHVGFTPKTHDCKTRPWCMFLGGSVLFVIVAAILIALTFVDGIFVSNSRTMIQFGVAIASSVVIYELLPVGYAHKNDMFNIIMTNSEDNCVAFNNFLYNKAKDLANEGFESIEFEEYEKSKFKPWTLLYVIQNNIYNNKLDVAEKLMTKLDEYSNVTNSYIKCEVGYQKIYLYLTSGRTKLANDYITDLEKQAKNAEDYHKSISALRSDILVSAFIENSLESTRESINIFKKACTKLPVSPRTNKEVEMLNNLIPRINSSHPDWKLEPISLENIKKEETSFEDDDD